MPILKLSIFLFIIVCTYPAQSKDYILSKRTVTEFEKLSQIQSDMEELQSIGNIFIAISPFKSLLDGFDVTDPLELTAEPWDLLATSAKGLSVHYKKQLKSFCEYEALKQMNSSDDYKFWIKMSKQFN